MAWVTLSDAFGSCEVTLFSEVLGRARALLAPGAALLVTADLRMEGAALRVTAQDVVGLEQAALDAGAGMRIWLKRTEALPHIRRLLDREGKGRGRVSLMPVFDSTGFEDQEVEVALPGGFAVTARLRQALKLIPGVERVDEL